MKPHPESRAPGRAAILVFLCATVVFGTAGCQSPVIADPAKTGPFFQPSNHAGDLALPPTLRRVVLLPVAGGERAPREATAVLDGVFATELQRQNRFEVVILDRSDCRRRFGAEEFSSAAALPRDFLPKIRREYAADAVLWVDVTAYSSYRPLILGIRAKLATITETRLLWTFDTVFSADDPAVANAARHHFIDQTHTAVPADLTPAVLQSPSKFATYVAAATFATLPPVAPPAPPTFPSNSR
jgi:hypothetical protein